MSEKGSAAQAGNKQVPKKKRGPKTPLPPRSAVAQRFLDIVDPYFPGTRNRDAALKTWFEKADPAWKSKAPQRWRHLSEFLSGREPRFDRPDLLARYATSLTGQLHHEQEFQAARASRNYAGDFAAQNGASAILEQLAGPYLCLRPSTTLSNGQPFKLDAKASAHLLDLRSHGNFQPGSFSYSTTAADGKSLGSWEGYAVANKREDIFLFGLCAEGEDASYFLLRQHPNKDFSKKLLVGIQSLLLPHPDENDPKHAVSRPIVAIRREFESPETKTAAINWINQNLSQSTMLLVGLPDTAAPKTRYRN
jgi:hypothetical protein